MNAATQEGQTALQTAQYGQGELSVASTSSDAQTYRAYHRAPRAGSRRTGTGADPPSAST